MLSECTFLDTKCQHSIWTFYKFQEQQLCTWTWWTCNMENSLLKHVLNTGMEDNWIINWLFWFEVCKPRSKESSVPPGDWVTSKKRKAKIFLITKENHIVFVTECVILPKYCDQFPRIQTELNNLKKQMDVTIT